MKVPVLTDGQMRSLGRVLNSVQTFDLTTQAGKQTRRLPVYETDTETGDNTVVTPFYVFYDTEKALVGVYGGYLSRNGDFIEVGGQYVAPENGYICVESILTDGEWSVPQIVIASPDAYHYPIGMCAVSEDGAVAVYPFRVPVAIIIATAYCPYSYEHNG